jgi:hypothetical protein
MSPYHITLFSICPRSSVADLASFVAIPALVVYLEEYDDFAIDMRSTLVGSDLLLCTIKHLETRRIHSSFLRIFGT